MAAWVVVVCRSKYSPRSRIHSATIDRNYMHTERAREATSRWGTATKDVYIFRTASTDWLTAAVYVGGGTVGVGEKIPSGKMVENFWNDARADPRSWSPGWPWRLDSSKTWLTADIMNHTLRLALEWTRGIAEVRRDCYHSCYLPASSYFSSSYDDVVRLVTAIIRIWTGIIRL